MAQKFTTKLIGYLKSQIGRDIGYWSLMIVTILSWKGVTEDGAI